MFRAKEIHITKYFLPSVTLAIKEKKENLKILKHLKLLGQVAKITQNKTCYSHVDKLWFAPNVPLEPYLVFQGEDVQVVPRERRRPLQQHASNFRGNPQVDRRVWFHCRQETLSLNECARCRC